MSTTPPPPPPPEDPFPPFESNGGDPFANGNGDDGLDQGRPNVAASPGRVIAVMVIMGGVLLFLLYNIFFSGGDEDEQAEPPAVTVAPATSTPPPPPLVEETPALPPPQLTTPILPTPAATPSFLSPEDDGQEKARQQARLRSEIMVSDATGGLGGVLGGGDSNSEEPVSEDPNLAFAANSMKANTKANRQIATHVGDLRRTIVQGRIIQATLESAINTDLPAPIRAIVARDVFAEAGTIPLIPKGSRLIGEYSTQLTGGQSRVYVMWTRVIRPDGVDVMLKSPLVDRIGQAGIGGQVDTKFQQVFSRAVLASIVTIGFALGSDEVTGGDGETSTTSSTFGTTQSGNGATTATVNALNRLGSVTERFLQNFIDVGPTILVDQGTPVNVFVNRDLVFPAEFAGTYMVP